MPETIYRMVVNETSGLEVGVDDGGAEKEKAATFEVFGDNVR